MRARHSDQQRRSPRVLTPARLLALVVSAVLLTGLVVLGVSGGPAPVAVPTGARAGDLSLAPCEYEGEDGPVAADCGTLVVAERAGTGRLLALPVVRVRSRSAEPADPVFFITGGPGQSNMDFGLADRYLDEHDVVLVGFRGIDGSVRLECPEVEEALRSSADLLDEATFRASAEAYRACAERLTASGTDPRDYGLVQQVDDLEAARLALGYDRVHLLSESAGTRTALIYAWRHPASINRSVLVGVNPPGSFLQDPAATAAQLDRFAALCAADDDCRARTDDLAATLRAVSADVPDRWLLLPVKEGNVRAMALLGMLEPRSGPASAPMTVDAWLSAAEGDASGLWATSLLADLLAPGLFVRGQYAAAASLDAAAARDYFARGSDDPTDLALAANALAWAGGRLADAWPVPDDASAYRRVATSRVETLLVSGELDTANPPQVARRELLPQLPNGRQVVLPGIGHTASFFGDQPAAGTRLVLTFLDTGRVDSSGYVDEALDLSPEQTFGSWARVVVGTMLVLAALLVVGLGVLAGRAWRGGRVGRRTEVAIRSAGAFVLGLGGWSLGALVVWAAVPTARADDGPLVVLTVAVPVALGVHWASGRPPGSRRAGLLTLAAIGAGAIAGGWVGLEATVAPASVVTAVVGAVAGANLAAVLLATSRDRRVGAGGATTPPAAPEAHPSPEAEVAR
jgi:pimeloyl-ACP methyl ester carboxylesterase